MAGEPRFCAKHVLQYLMYIVAIGVCVAGLLYILMHAHPMVSSPVKKDAASKLLESPIRIQRTLLPRAV